MQNSIRAEQPTDTQRSHPTPQQEKKQATGIAFNESSAFQNCFGVLQNYHMWGYLPLYNISVCFHESSVCPCDEQNEMPALLVACN